MAVYMTRQPAITPASVGAPVAAEGTDRLASARANMKLRHLSRYIQYNVETRKQDTRT